MLFDTHCHLNIESLHKKLNDIIADANQIGVKKILIPGVTLESSKIALEIANRYENILVGVGVHPITSQKLEVKNSHCVKTSRDKQILEMRNLLLHPKVVAVGEIGLDYHKLELGTERGDNSKTLVIQNSKREKDSQKELFIEQLRLAIKYKKSVIIHNRESKDDLLEILNDNWNDFFSHRMVFHCCEPYGDLLDFAKAKKIFIGVDGDITYKKSKQEFVKNIPQELLVLETDSPFLIPEPLKSQKISPNEPKNLEIISLFVSNLLKIKNEKFEKQIWENSSRLFLS